MPVTICCKLCGKGFSVKPSQVKNRVYCSKECMSESYKSKRLKKICESCNKPFEVPDRPSRANARFCSKKCMGDGKSGENHWNYKHGQKWLPETKKLYMKNYAEQHKEKALQRAFLGKIKRRQSIVSGSHTFLEWIELLKQHNNKCFYCGIKMTKKMGMYQRSRDHIIAVSNGGSDDISNIVPACRSCNSSKGTKTFEEWKRVTVIETALDPSGTE